MAKSKYRGRDIETTKDNTWIFSDTKQDVSEDAYCKCGHCGLEATVEDHDGCLGTLVGVVNACCGHGVESEAYVQFADGSCIRGKDAKTIQHILKRASIN